MYYILYITFKTTPTYYKVSTFLCPSISHFLSHSPRASCLIYDFTLSTGMAGSPGLCCAQLEFLPPNPIPPFVLDHTWL